MKPLIKWVDEVVGDGFGRTLPSHLLALAKGVRTEALDLFELKVRQTRASSTAEGELVLCEHLLTQIKVWRNA